VSQRLVKARTSQEARGSPEKGQGGREGQTTRPSRRRPSGQAADADEMRRAAVLGWIEDVIEKLTSMRHRQAQTSLKSGEKAKQDEGRFEAVMNAASSSRAGPEDG